VQRGLTSKDPSMREADGCGGPSARRGAKSMATGQGALPGIAGRRPWYRLSVPRAAAQPWPPDSRSPSCATRSSGEDRRGRHVAAALVTSLAERHEHRSQWQQTSEHVPGSRARRHQQAKPFLRASGAVGEGFDSSGRRRRSGYGGRFGPPALRRYAVGSARHYDQGGRGI
jgi:hypothetical protein